jgi:hypothetical protein
MKVLEVVVGHTEVLPGKGGPHPIGDTSNGAMEMVSHALGGPSHPL